MMQRAATRQAAPAKDGPQEQTSLSQAATEPVGSKASETTTGALFWRQAAQSGLLAATPGLNPAAAGALSQAAQRDLLGLVENLEKAGLTFSRDEQNLEADEVALSALQGQDLQVQAGQAEAAAVDGLGDLAALDALYNGSKEAPVVNKPLVGALRHLEANGVQFFDNRQEAEPEMGAFGAWSLLHDGGEQDSYVVKTAPIPDSITGALHLDSALGLQKTSFFRFDGPGEGLPHVEAATTLRGLAQQGCEFDTSDSADYAYQRMVEDPDLKLSVRFGNAEIGELGLAEFSDPGSVAGHTPDLARFWGQALAPRVEADELYEENAGAQLERLKEDLGENLPAQAYNAAEAEQFKTEYLQLAHSARDVKVARQAWEMTGFQLPGESREQRLEVMQSLMASESQLGRLQDDGDAEGSIETQRALDGYKLLLTHRLPEQSMAEAASTLTSVLLAVAPKEGWQEASEAFVFLQKGIAHGDLAGDAPEAFVERYMLNQSLDEARNHITGGELNEEITFEESSVLVGDHSLRVEL